MRLPDTRSPNVLLFLMDQIQSFSVGCNGNGIVRTPNIDRLAEQGCTFTRAYCSNPVCQPSRATIATGLSPSQHGCLTNGNILSERIPTAAEIFANHGYRTHCAGKIHLQPFMARYDPKAHQGRRTFSWEDSERWRSGEIAGLPAMYYGFQTSDYVGGHVHYCFGDYDNWLRNSHPGMREKYLRANAYEKPASLEEYWRIDIPPELHYNNWIADQCIGFIDSLSTDERFFLVCSFPDPHHPFVSCKPYSETYDPQVVDLSPTWEISRESIPCLQKVRRHYRGTVESEEVLRQIVAQYYGMITHIDHNVGRVMSHLERRGLDRETLVVVTADHGEYLGSHGLLYKNPWQWEELLRVPLVWRVPGAWAPGRRADAVVSLLDLVPTLLDYGGIPQTELQWRNGEQLHRMSLPGQSLRPLLSEGSALPHNRAFVEYDEDWFMGYDGEKSELPFYRVRSVVAERYKAVVYGNNDYGILMDLATDPHETNNLWNDPDHRETRSRLLEELLLYMIRTDRMDSPRISSA